MQMNFNPNASTSTLLIHPSKVMEWTNDDALELIEQYRGHTELWNRADPKYKDKLCRFRAWSEIAERFGCSKAEVERKMNVLLTQYRREKHKMLVKLYQGIQPNPSKWYAFKRFDFMESGMSIGGSLSTSSGGGGGSSSSGGSTGSNAGGGPTNGRTLASVALNGLGGGGGGYDSTTGAAVVATTPTSHHRRMKTKEMKYFGAMGLNLPLLIANSQTLDSWNNAVGQYSPPLSERGQLRVPLPMSFSTASQNELTSGPQPRTLFGGSSISVDMPSSPGKPMETADIDDDNKDVAKRECEQERCMSSVVHETCPVNGLGASGPAGSECGGGGSGCGGTESGSSPIPNTNIHEAHQNHRHRSSDREDLDIKCELVDYFHAPHPPAPPDSHRSYSSTEENRLGGAVGSGGNDSDDYAQDLRVSAAAAAASKNLDFSQFVLPRNLRRSSESMDDPKFMPLNMRKLSASSASVATAASTAGHMLMNSLLSNESMSEDTETSGVGVHAKSGGSQDNSTTSAAAAAAAAAIYAESLNKDDCDFIGSNVSLKLRSMDRTQRIIAEKLISEVLFYGQFSELERSARIQPK